MPRIAGQIDQAKTEAILAAAGEAIFLRGLNVSMDEIARIAGVSKQTIYNHYGSKAEMLRAMIEQRVEQIAAPLELPGAFDRPEQALADYARLLLQTISMPRGIALFRLIIASAGSDPDLAGQVFQAGARASRIRLSQFLEREARVGRIVCDDAIEAADYYAGMVVSHHQLQGLLGLPLDLTDERIERIAVESARRFLRAYAP